jgi:hypothetical protein
VRSTGILAGKVVLSVAAGELHSVAICSDGTVTSWGSNNFGQLGVAFGPGTNTFWAKNVNSPLYLVQFDLNSNSGFVLYAFSNSVPLNLRAISAHSSQKYLAGIALDTSVNARLFDVSNLAVGPVLRDQEVFATLNPNVTVGGTGATAFGGDYLFALDSNNGIKAFLLNTNFVPAVGPFMITDVARNGSELSFRWVTTAGRNYQVQFRDAVASGNWSNIGSTIPGTGGFASFTNTVTSPATRFFRVQGQ